MGASTVNTEVNEKSLKDMSKYKTGHFETFQDDMFPQVFTKSDDNGETILGKQPKIDEIWDWFGHPEIEDNV